MGTIVDKQEVLPDDVNRQIMSNWKEKHFTRWAYLNQKILCSSIRRNQEKTGPKKNKKRVADGENNEIEEELNIDEIESSLVNDIIPKLEVLGESYRRNTHFMRFRYVLARHGTKFSFEFIPSHILWRD